MGKEIVNQVQEAQRVSYRVNPRRNTPRHILIKLTKTKHRETNNTTTDIKNTLEGINSRISEAEE